MQGIKESGKPFNVTVGCTDQIFPALTTLWYSGLLTFLKLSSFLFYFYLLAV